MCCIIDDESWFDIDREESVSHRKRESEGEKQGK